MEEQVNEILKLCKDAFLENRTTDWSDVELYYRQEIEAVLNTKEHQERMTEAEKIANKIRDEFERFRTNAFFDAHP